MENNIPENLLDNQGYPTDEFLEFIKKYTPGSIPILDFIDIICEGWYHGSYGYKLHRKYRGKRKFELHTCGWGGNELIIRSIKENITLTHFSMSYVMWKTGGHYYFEIDCKR